MSQNLNSAVAVIGIDIGKNSFHVVGLDDRGAIVLRQKWSRGQIEARLANAARLPQVPNRTIKNPPYIDTGATQSHSITDRSADRAGAPDIGQCS